MVASPIFIMHQDSLVDSKHGAPTNTRDNHTLSATKPDTDGSLVLYFSYCPSSQGVHKVLCELTFTCRDTSDNSISKTHRCGVTLEENKA